MMQIRQFYCRIDALTSSKPVISLTTSRVMSRAAPQERGVEVEIESCPVSFIRQEAEQGRPPRSTKNLSRPSSPTSGRRPATMKVEDRRIFRRRHAIAPGRKHKPSN